MKLFGRTTLTVVGGSEYVPPHPSENDLEPPERDFLATMQRLDVLFPEQSPRFAVSKKGELLIRLKDVNVPNAFVYESSIESLSDGGWGNNPGLEADMMSHLVELSRRAYLTCLARGTHDGEHDVYEFTRKGEAVANWLVLTEFGKK